MGNELIKIVTTKYGKISIYGCWEKDTPEGCYDFYDIYDSNEECLNLGNPFWYEEGPPTTEAIEEFMSVKA